MTVDVAIPGDRNVIKKEAEKILKYKNLTTESQCMWNVNAKVIPVIIEVTGTITITWTIPEKHTRTPHNEGTAKNSHIGQCTHIAESANVKVQNIFHGQNNITCSKNCHYSTAAIVYTLETWFVSFIIIYTLHKGDNKDDDDYDDDDDDSLITTYDN
jgi:hypothetical protein